MCARQAKEYEETKQREKDATQKQKEKDEEFHSKMNTYQKNIGAVPPGVKGIEGGGRRQHSTNLNLEEPVSNLYANSSSASTTARSGSPQNSSASRNSLSSSTDLHSESYASFGCLQIASKEFATSILVMTKVVTTWKRSGIVSWMPRKTTWRLSRF